MLKKLKKKLGVVLINELNDLMYENPWQDIQISLSGIDSSEQKKLVIHNAVWADNQCIIRQDSNLSKSAANQNIDVKNIQKTKTRAGTSQFFQPSTE